MPVKPRPIADRFWPRVAVGGPNECWLWGGGQNGAGYGKLYSLEKGGHVLAHRVAWELTIGPIMKGLCALHKCDTPRCVNPAHLFLGTKKDNTRDMWAKGRHSPPPRVEKRGEDNHRTRLTDADVLSIRDGATAGVSQRVLAERYGVKQQAISKIVRGQRWAHLPLCVTK